MSLRAIEAGAVAFLTKPFRDQDLLDAIQASLTQDPSADKMKFEVSEPLD